MPRLFVQATAHRSAFVRVRQEEENIAGDFVDAAGECIYHLFDLTPCGLILYSSISLEGYETDFLPDAFTEDGKLKVLSS